MKENDVKDIRFEIIYKKHADQRDAKHAGCIIN